MAVYCDVCGRDTGLSRYKIMGNKYICTRCYICCGSNRMITLDQAKNIIEKIDYNLSLISQFKTAKKVGNFLEVDQENRKWMIYPDGNREPAFLYNYEDLVDFELLENGTSVAKGGLGRAVVGGLLLGGVGAIVGGVTGSKKSQNICNSMIIKVTVQDLSNPAINVQLIAGGIKTNSILYQQATNMAQEALSVFQVICRDVEQRKQSQPVEVSQPSAANEILKYKQLLDMGAITLEEYEAKKKQLLGL